MKWSNEWEVMEEELRRAVRRMTRKNTVLTMCLAECWALPSDRIRLKQIFTDCLRTGWFSSEWKRANLVLLRKGSRSADSLSAYRPIYLLEASKLLERIVAVRLTEHLSRVSPDLTVSSSSVRDDPVDAVFRLEFLTDASIKQGGGRWRCH